MIYFIITIISLLIGYYLGLSKANNLQSQVSDFKNGVSRLQHMVGKQFTPTIPTGQIKPKTADDIAFIKRPQKEKEGMQAMKETLDKIPKPTEKDEIEFYG